MGYHKTSLKANLKMSISTTAAARKNLIRDFKKAVVAFNIEHNGSGCYINIKKKKKQ